MLSLKEIFNKKSLRIVVTDSGLGGLSIAAEIENRLRNSDSYEELEMIFYNSAPAQTGYNQMKNENQKVSVFNSALNGMKNLYNPDLIIIACNTLSVLYPKTDFSKNSGVPVLGIVDSGVKMIFEEIEKTPESKIILLGTETTIKSDEYKLRLVKKGITGNRIINQSCKSLESEIQKNPKSDYVKEIIEQNIAEALSKEEDTRCKYIFAFCCTHYHLSEDLFFEVITNLVNKKFTIIDLNKALIASLPFDSAATLVNNAIVKCAVTTRYKIEQNEISYLSKLLKPISPLFSYALQNYKLNTKLFYV